MAIGNFKWDLQLCENGKIEIQSQKHLTLRKRQELTLESHHRREHNFKVVIVLRSSVIHLTAKSYMGTRQGNLHSNRNDALWEVGNHEGAE
ncbi:hypothetical protein RND71_008110 [Anisodus tanguticus]|uniref:Uncharacterized protein n=1 Tax=Anisodus tanguticus TaxID=243964 RepID=A0AAE1SQ77_9SOLA|nr:hypothetical protein RND71_008110 [Anisodus tanguticus]